MDKLISEFRVIETEDGFRIEIKGDKEKIRSCVERYGFPREWSRWHRPHPGHGWNFWGATEKMWKPSTNCKDHKEETRDETEVTS